MVTITHRVAEAEMADERSGLRSRGEGSRDGPAFFDNWPVHVVMDHTRFCTVTWMTLMAVPRDASSHRSAKCLNSIPSQRSDTSLAFR
jgi:hypothetical protein